MVRDPNTGEITARPGTAADGTADQPTPGEPPRSGEPQLLPAPRHPNRPRTINVSTGAESGIVPLDVEI